MYAHMNERELDGGDDCRNDYANPVVTGAASNDGQYLAVVEAEGHIRVFMTVPHHEGGLLGSHVPLPNAGGK